MPPIGLVELQPGEFIRGSESGGGGYGPPVRRDPRRVLKDVLEGWVSLRAAREVYAVALTGNLEDDTLVVDAAATERLRAGPGARAASHDRVE